MAFTERGRTRPENRRHLLLHGRHDLPRGAGPLRPILAGWAIKFSAVEKFLIIHSPPSSPPCPGPDAPRPVDRYAGRAGIHDKPVLPSAIYRMVPGSSLESQMQSGFQLFPVLIGLFAVSRCSSSVRLACTPPTARMIRWRSEQRQVQPSPRLPGDHQCVRSALLGTFMGILPGVGGSWPPDRLLPGQSWSKHPSCWAPACRGPDRFWRLPATA